MRIPSGVVDQYIYFVAVDATDYVSRETGLSSFTVYRSRNGGAAAAYTTPTINETSSANMPGVYELLLDEDMTIDSGDDSQEIVLHITHAGMAPVTRTFELYRPASADIATSIFTAQMTEDYAANGVAPTLAEALFAIHQMLMQFSISSTTYTVKKLDNSTTAFAVTLNDGTSPTSAVRV
jgi:hypothetical protein